MDRAPTEGNYIIQSIGQFPSSVIAFSSQYGSGNSSYTAHQLISNGTNGPTVYPRYGDFCEACVLRYYGKWWSQAPSAAPLVGTHPSCYPDGYCAEDFLEVKYADPVYLSQVRVYETFIPGCLVSIFAGSVAVDGGTTEWHRVWHRSGPTKEAHCARIFEPQLTNRPRRPVDRLWLEFNSSLAEYYTEIDTIELVGSLTQPVESDPLLCDQMQSMRIGVAELPVEQQPPAATSESHTAAGWFGDWPSELLTKLLGYLDMRSLLRLGQSCRLLHEFASDPLLYRSVSLRPYCLRLNDTHLLSLANRISATRHLEMSWCSSGITSDPFCQFLLGTGSCLTTLRLASCGFLDDQCLTVIGTYCGSLVDLDLSNCYNNVTQSGFMSLSSGLTRLRHLNLYRSSITWEPLAALLSVNPALSHANLGACVGLAECGQRVAQALGRHCRELRSLDMWRNRSLDSVGLAALADNCPGLVELDIGWCPVDTRDGCLAHLVQRCRGLQKLFLTANRTVNDMDLQAIAKHCKELRQFDILGTSMVSRKSVVHVLESCPKLEMFDVSFCGNVKRSFIDSIRDSFPHCAIQMSFQDQR